MATVTLTAASVLSQNGYAVINGATGDFTIADTETMINDAIDQVNQLARRSIPPMAGVAGSKTATLNREEAPAVKVLLTIMLREGKKTSLSNSSSTSGSNSSNKSWNLGPVGASTGTSVGTSISATSALNNAANSPLMDLFNRLIEQLLRANVDWSRAFI
jgi:hypothetical protein